MLLSSFGAKFWKTWCGLCEVLIGRWGRLGANFTNTLLICGFSGRIMWLSLSCRLVLPFCLFWAVMDVFWRSSSVFLLWADVLWQQSLISVPPHCCSAMDADGLIVWRGIDTTWQKQVFRSQFCKFSEKNRGRGFTKRWGRSI